MKEENITKEKDIKKKKLQETQETIEEINETVELEQEDKAVEVENEKINEEINEENIEVENKVEEEIELTEESQNPDVSILEDEQEEIGKEEQPKTKKDALHKYTIFIAVISVLLLIGLGIFSTVFALMNRSSDKIVNGIYVKGIDVSGLTKEEAINKVNDIFVEKLKQNITLKHNEYETSISPEQMEMNFGVQDSIDMAYSVGRTGKILKDNYTIINAGLTKLEVNPAYQYNEKVIDDFITSAQGDLPDAVKQSGYSVEGNNLLISKGEKGVVINQEKLKKSIIDESVNITSDPITIQIPTQEKEPDGVDIQKIHSEIYKEPQDAYYTKEPFKVYPHVNGMDFAISVEEASNLLNSDQVEITIPLKITKPNKTTNQIGTEAFPDLLASYSTTFSTKNTNRTTNIKLSSNKINGVVLMPGQQFSFNTVVGKRTVGAGYKTAAVYVAGKVEQGIGGGICQTSSTLYNTALRANLEIVRRYNHRFDTGYVPLSTDATVSWGGPEFIFKNSRKYPVKIVSSVNGGKITISMYGCKENTEYEVQIKSETLQTIPMKTVYRTNTALAKGSKKTVQKGHGGYKSRAYRILKLDGKVVSKQLLSTDTYAQLETIIEQNP